MEPKCIFLMCLVVCGLYLRSNAQDTSSVKFGQVSARDFDLPKNRFDTGTSAVIIADIGSSSIEANPQGWFSLIYKRYTRIKILGKNGLGTAQKIIRLYSDGETAEKLDNVKASTYNLEDGKVRETVLDNSSIFTEQRAKKVIEKKFALPAVKEGSIIEYSYTISSSFLHNLQPWVFQGDYPCLWSEYEVYIPQYFRYVFLSQGYLPYSINSQSVEHKLFTITFPTSLATSRS